MAPSHTLTRLCVRVCPCACNDSQHARNAYEFLLERGIGSSRLQQLCHRLDWDHLFSAYSSTAVLLNTIIEAETRAWMRNKESGNNASNKNNGSRKTSATAAIVESDWLWSVRGPAVNATASASSAPLQSDGDWGRW